VCWLRYEASQYDGARTSRDAVPSAVAGAAAERGDVPVGRACGGRRPHGRWAGVCSAPPHPRPPESHASSNLATVATCSFGHGARTPTFAVPVARLKSGAARSQCDLSAQRLAVVVRRQAVDLQAVGTPPTFTAAQHAVCCFLRAVDGRRIQHARAKLGDLGKPTGLSRPAPYQGNHRTRQVHSFRPQCRPLSAK
jgi:hypothetical protein